MSRVVVQLACFLPLLSEPTAPPKGSGDGPKQAAVAESGDLITLKDGRVLVGVVLDGSVRTGIRLILRRDELQREAPELADRWAKIESARTAEARRLRRTRLEAWRVARPGDDRISRWIDDQLRAEGPVRSAPPLLTVMTLRSTEIRSVSRAPSTRTLALQTAWAAGVRDPERLSFEELQAAVESRGFLLDGNPVELSGLLPLEPETDVEWLGRRGATEIANDPGLRFIRFGSIVMPEPAAGAAPDPTALAGVFSDTVRRLVEDAPVQDPLLAALRSVEARGRVGAVVTETEVSHDGRSVRATCTLWLRGRQGWFQGVRRVARTSSDDIPAGEGAQLEQDPRVASVFGMIDSIAPGAVAPEMKRKALAAGAATQRALSEARGRLERDLARLDLMAAADETPGRPILEPRAATR
ncbi:MAG: hypothetical protein SFX72_02365 [Isosphaeraceae bacterium]|nr:hypothetical protein [Isosphaeraceae bacterium]